MTKPKTTEIVPKKEQATTDIVLAPKVEIDYAGLVKQLVDARVAEIMADKQSEDFRPFFETQEVSIELRRRQTVAERKKFPVYHERWGCMFCERKDRPYFTLGMCRSCFGRIQKRLFDIRRDLMVETQPPEVGFRDGVELARKALMPSIEKLARKRR